MLVSAWGRAASFPVFDVSTFIEHYNHRRYHESLGNVTPADAYFGRASDILAERNLIKRQTIQHRRLQHRKIAA